MHLRERLRATLAASLAILLTSLVSSRFIQGAGLPSLIASMGASAVILFALPHSPMARAWPLVGGHLICGLIGVLCAQTIPHLWLAAPVTVGLAIFAMHLARCLHPPGGASALLPLLVDDIQRQGFQFLLTPLALNMAVLLLASLIHNRLCYPQTAATSGATPPASPQPLQRFGIQTDDLRAALLEINEFVDVEEEELNTLYNLAADRAFRREFGQLECARIMSREPPTAEFGTGLQEAWSLMQRYKLNALPVVDRSRHVIGIISLSDFFRHAGADRYQSLGEKLGRLLRYTPTVTSEKPEVVGQIMTAQVLTAGEDADIAELAHLLTEHGVHQIPIVDQRRKLVGLVTQTDLIAALYRLIGNARS